MAAALEDIERRRIELQERTAILRRALVHWTTLEAEYAAIHDAVQAAPDAASVQVAKLARDAAGSLVTARDIANLLGCGDRSAAQVAGLVSRRIDYVRQNAASAEKQLDLAEKQLAGVDVLLEPGVENEEGLPMMDIEEELDDAGNEISSSVSQTGKAAVEAVAALRRPGLQKSTFEASQTSREELVSPIASTPVNLSSLVDDAAAVATEKKEPNFETLGYNRVLAAININSGTKVIKLDENDEHVVSYPIIPQDESLEDAELRRQMLQYGLSEVGQVVAELDLDHPTVQYLDEDDYDSGEEVDDHEDEDGDDKSFEDDEDEYGCSRQSAITEDYLREMQELEKKLDARMVQNIGLKHSIGMSATDPKFTLDDSGSTQPLGKSSAAPARKAVQKKGVRFANDLGIADPPQPVQPPVPRPESHTQPKGPLSDVVVERSIMLDDLATAPKSTNTSSFKSERLGTMHTQARILPTPPVAAAPPVPSGPVGRTLANIVIEHMTNHGEPYAPDEFDPHILNHEIQAQYHKARNRYIQSQSGFKAGDGEEQAPVVEYENRPPKKISRFRAARLDRSGL